MNCREAEQLILTERDGVLTTDQRAALAQHAAACSACRAMQASLATALDELRADAARLEVPDADEEWRLLQVEIRAQQRNQTAGGRGANILKWFGTPLAAAAALAFAFYAGRATAPRPLEEFTVPDVSRADFVEVANADATPIVFRDEESGWLVVWAEESDSAHG